MTIPGLAKENGVGRQRHAEYEGPHDRQRDRILVEDIGECGEKSIVGKFFNPEQGHAVSQ